MKNKDVGRILPETDLAYECLSSDGRGGKADRDGIECSERQESGITVTRLWVKNAAGAEKIGKPAGHYLTADIGQLWHEGSRARENARSVVATLIRETIYAAAGESVLKSGCILLAGLGNRAVTADALGPRCVDAATVTRHIISQDPALFKRLGSAELAALAPGVVGQTGIETAEFVKGACQGVGAALVIAIDALAARSTERLGTTVQICDTGISPGSGIGNRRAEISSATLGAPVIAIGVPTVVSAATLVLDTLEQAGTDSLTPELESALRGKRDFYVSLRESDEAVTVLASLISGALSDVLGTGFI